MEKQKNRNAEMSLLRMDSFGVDPGAAQEQYINNAEDEDSDMEEKYEPIAHPAFEAAFSTFMEVLENSAIFYQSDAISNELADRINPEKVISTLISKFGAQNDMDEIVEQIESYTESFEKAIRMLKSMEMKGATEAEIEKEEAELFTKIALKFENETSDFGDATYEFALKRLYMDFMQVSNMDSKHGHKIFDFFAIAGNPEYKKNIYDELSGNIKDS